MKKLFFILTAAVLFGTSALAAKAKEDCADKKIRPTVALKTSYGQLHYDFDTSRDGIKRLADRLGMVELDSVAGLAVVNVKQSYAISFLQEIMPDGSLCSIPAHVDIFIGYGNPKIYIADDLKMGSCEYNLVLRHEQTHQQINISALNYFLPRLKTAAEKIAASLTPVSVKNIKNVKQANARLSNEFGRKFAALIEVFEKELHIEQSKLDNAHNYQMEGAVCNEYETKRKSLFKRKK